MKNKNPNIYIICGKARTGKDTVANIIKNSTKNSVILSITKPLKEYAKLILNEDFNDSNKPRDLLQELGYDIIKKQIDSTLLIRRIIEDINVLSYYKNNIIISGIRLEDEIECIKNTFNNVKVIKVLSDRDNNLTSKQKKHITETELDNYKADYEIINDKYNLLENKVKDILEENYE